MIKTYDSLPKLVKIILQIFFGWLISPLYRIIKAVKNASVLQLIIAILLHLLLAVIMWWVDLITIILHNKITVLA